VHPADPVGAVINAVGERAYRSGTKPSRLPMRECRMADKSPRHSMSKKSGKSIKEKRVEKKAKADTTSQMDRLTHDKKN
jgi:hypothetical protein